MRLNKRNPSTAPLLAPSRENNFLYPMNNCLEIYPLDLHGDSPITCSCSCPPQDETPVQVFLASQRIRALLVSLDISVADIIHTALISLHCTWKQPTVITKPCPESRQLNAATCFPNEASRIRLAASALI